MKSQFQSSAKIVEYMARYTHKSAIANSRIISIDNNIIRFKYKDYKESSKTNRRNNILAIRLLRLSDVICAKMLIN